MAQNIFLDKYVNIIGRFWMGDDEDTFFFAQLAYREQDYLLIGNMLSIHTYRKILDTQKSEAHYLNFYGEIEGTCFSLMNSTVPKSSSTNTDPDDHENGWRCFIEIEPGEIAFGGFYVNDETTISSSNVEFDKINELIHLLPYKFDLQNGLIFKSSPSIKCNTKEFRLIFDAKLSYLGSFERQEFKNYVSTVFFYESKVKIYKAREHIALTQMFFSMLKLSYIGLNSIELIKEHFDDPCQQFSLTNIVKYHLNFTSNSVKEAWPVPAFCLKFEHLENKFGTTIDNWFEFWSSAKPIVELFYQILIERSYDINQFLNLAQALEVYSNRFRREEVKRLLDERPRDKGKPCEYTGQQCPEKENLPATTWHKIYDLLVLTNICFGFDKMDIEIIASWIADTRNYYTHYGNSKKKKALTTINKRETINRFMKYLLIILIYEKLGIDIDLIAKEFYHPFYQSTLQQVNELLDHKKDKK
ncbi:MAG: hypothetical protein PHT02_11120 [Tissierellia bacterium]|nr:hypothetical protein [Tissierellia bacterium]